MKTVATLIALQQNPLTAQAPSPQATRTALEGLEKVRETRRTDRKARRLEAGIAAGEGLSRAALKR